MSFDLMKPNFGKVTPDEVRAYIKQSREGAEMMAKMGNPIAPDSIAAWNMHALESLAAQVDHLQEVATGFVTELHPTVRPEVVQWIIHGGPTPPQPILDEKRHVEVVP